MKRKIMSLLVTLCLALALFPVVPAAAAAPVNVTVDGVPVQFNKNTGIPFIDSNGRTQVPLRATMEAMGADVGWNNYERAASVVKSGICIIVPIGENFVYTSGGKENNDTAAQIKDGRTYLPIRIVAEQVGCKVFWDDSSRTVAIQTAEYSGYSMVTRYVGEIMRWPFMQMGYHCTEGWDDETDSPCLVYEKEGIWFCLEMDGPYIATDSPATYHHPLNKVLAIKSTGERYIIGQMSGNMSANEIAHKIIENNYQLISDGYYADEDGYGKPQYRVELAVSEEIEWEEKYYNLTYVWEGNVPDPDTKSSYAVLRAN